MPPAPPCPFFLLEPSTREELGETETGNQGAALHPVRDPWPWDSFPGAGSPYRSWAVAPPPQSVLEPWVLRAAFSTPDFLPPRPALVPAPQHPTLSCPLRRDRGVDPAHRSLTHPCTQ